MKTRSNSRSSAGRQVGSRSKRDSQTMTDVQQILLGAMVVFCWLRDTAMFVGTRSTTGSIRLNFYPPDDKCSGSINLLDDWQEEVPTLLSDIFDEEISLEDVLRAVPWAARKLSDAPRDAKPALVSAQAVETPLRPSGKA